MGDGQMDGITHVGLDVHKATVCVAVAESGRGGEVRQVGVFENRAEILRKMAARLGKAGRGLSFCYEAGPCGYGLHRLLTGCGHSCIVVAPSLIPMKSGDRVKKDRRDAMMLAKLHRAGELTATWIPDAAHEAMRDLVRARATAGQVLSKARQHLQGFLLRHDRIYRGARAWTLAYRRWLTTARFEHSAQQIVLQDYIYAVEDAEARGDRLTRQIEEVLPRWSMAPVVAALQAMRGVAMVVAVTLVAEVGDFRRFANTRQLMVYFGLVPSSHSGHCVESAGPAVRAISAPCRSRQAQGRSHHHDCPRDGRLNLGESPASPSRLSTDRPANGTNLRRRGGRAQKSNGAHRRRRDHGGKSSGLL